MKELRGMKKMNKIKLIAIIGRSASGKDYLFRHTLKNNPDLNPVIHYTTRPRRDGEVDGKDYFFVTETEFQRKEDNYEFFSITSFRDWRYGVDSNSFDPKKINIGIFNPFELHQLHEFFKDKFQFVIVETLADEKTRYLRSLDRLKPYDKEGLKELCRRNKADEQDFETIKDIPRFSLNTTDFFADTYNQGFMDAIVKLLGEYD
jgi:guanylate kinase